MWNRETLMIEEPEQGAPATGTRNANWRAIAVLNRQRWPILASLFVSIVAAWVYARYIPHTYAATARINAPHEASKNVSELGLLLGQGASNVYNVRREIMGTFIIAHGTQLFHPVVFGNPSGRKLNPFRSPDSL